MALILDTPAKRKAHFESQQMPTVIPSGKALDNVWRLQALRAKEDRLNALARQYREVADLIEENKLLKKRLATRPGSKELRS